MDYASFWGTCDGWQDGGGGGGNHTDTSPPRLLADCDKNKKRGDQASCWVSAVDGNGAPAQFELSEVRLSYPAASEADTVLSHPTGLRTQEWRIDGTATTAMTMTVTGSSGGHALTAIATLTPGARTFVFRQSAAQDLGFVESRPADRIFFAPANSQHWETAFTVFNAVETANGFLRGAPAAGELPSSGIIGRGTAFFRSMPAGPSPVVVFTPDLNPGSIGGWPQRVGGWYQDQNGVGSGTCTQPAAAKLLTEIRDHEGLTGQPNSHWGILEAVLAGNNSGARVEAHVLGTRDYNDARHALAGEVWNIYTQTIISPTTKALQENLDARDSLLASVVASAYGCSFDYNRSDS